MIESRDTRLKFNVKSPADAAEQAECILPLKYSSQSCFEYRNHLIIMSISSAKNSHSTATYAKNVIFDSFKNSQPSKH